MVYIQQVLQKNKTNKVLDKKIAMLHTQHLIIV
jgi:hypothetical protein